MTEYIKSSFIKEDIIKIKEIPTILLSPKDIKEPLPTVVFYHGWASSKEKQRLRGYILASMGYQVVIPDAINHGDRSPLKYYNIEDATKYFWDVIFNNIVEFGTIFEELVSKWDADPERIAVMGNSMGGFSAGGIFTHNKNIKTLIIFNGSCAWEDYSKDLKKAIGVLPNEKIEVVKKTIEDLDPLKHLSKLKDRPILMMHGDSDTVVPIESQKDFYNALHKVYLHKEKIKFIQYENLNHFVTTNMLEESIQWLGKYL